MLITAETLVEETNLQVVEGFHLHHGSHSVEWQAHFDGLVGGEGCEDLKGTSRGQPKTAQNSQMRITRGE